MKRFIIPVILCLAACQQNRTVRTTAIPVQPQTPADSVTEAETIATVPQADTLFATGDFNGDHTMDTAFSIFWGRPAGEDQPDEYRVQFASGALPEIGRVEGRTRLINEGDLNNDGADELSFFSEPLHGCIYSFTTWTFISGEWKRLANPQLIPTACEPLTDKALQERILLENDTVFIWLEDMNDENFKLVKTRLELKAE